MAKMMKKKTKKSPRRRQKKAEPPNNDQKEVHRTGDEIEEALNKLDELVDKALAEGEEEGERQAQEFVDHFRQQGGQ